MELIRYTEASSPGFRASLDTASVSLSRLHKCSKLTLTLEVAPMFILSQSEVLSRVTGVAMVTVRGAAHN